MLVAVAVALVIATIGFNLLLARSNDAERRFAPAAARRLGAQPDPRRPWAGCVPVETSSDDGRSTAESGSSRAAQRSRRRGRAPQTNRGRTGAGAAGRAGSSTVEDTDERLYALPIIARGAARRHDRHRHLARPLRADTALGAASRRLVFAATVLLIVGAAAAWLLRSALRPVALMTEQAEAWSEHDLDRRFGLGEPHDELTRLASTLDRLLDRIAASLRHERRFSAELSHELRTPLAKVTAEAELALRRPRDPEEYREALARSSATRGRSLASSTRCSPPRSRRPARAASPTASRSRMPPRTRAGRSPTSAGSS